MPHPYDILALRAFKAGIEKIFNKFRLTNFSRVGEAKSNYENEDWDWWYRNWNIFCFAKELSKLSFCYSFYVELVF